MAGATIGAAISGILRRRLNPATATRVLTLTAVGTALALTWATLSLLVGSLGHPGWLADVAGWCQHLYQPEVPTVPPFVGVSAGALLLAGGAGLVRMGLRERRALRAVPEGNGPISVVDLPEALA